MLDIPCGDFRWMRNVDLSNTDYMGADIVNDLIQHNVEKYGREHVRFQKLNLIKDESVNSKEKLSSCIKFINACHSKITLQYIFTNGLLLYKSYYLGESKDDEKEENEFGFHVVNFFALSDIFIIATERLSLWDFSDAIAKMWISMDVNCSSKFRQAFNFFRKTFLRQVF